MAEYKNSIQESIVGSSAADKVTLTGTSYSTVDAGAGNDIVTARYGSNFNRYDMGVGNDVVYVAYDSLKGSDYNSIVGGNGNTISGGAGNDTIYLGPVNANIGGADARDYNTVIEFSNDDGTDTIKDSISGGGTYSDYTIKLTSGKLASTQVSGKNIIITVDPSSTSETSDTGKIILEGAAVAQTVSGETIPGATLTLVGDGEIFVSRNHDNASKIPTYFGDSTNDFNKAILVGTKDADGNLAEISNRGHDASIGGSFTKAYNYGANVTITGGKTAVTVENRGSGSVVKGSSVADYVYNYNDGNNINGNAGNDVLENVIGHKSSIFGGAGNDTLKATTGREVTLNGGKDNDTIYNSAEGTVIIGDAGNDVVSLNGGSALVQYATGTGTDTIYGFSDNDTLHITKGNITSAATVAGTEEGKTSLVLTIKSGSTITLKDAVKESGASINLKVGTFETINVDTDTLVATTSKTPASWTFKDGVATYGTVDKPLAQITGVSSDATADDFQVKGTTITVLNGSALTQDGTAKVVGSYKLALGTGVEKSTTTAGKWTNAGNSGSTANYLSAKVTAGYVLSSDKKSITYNQASKLSGVPVASVSGLAKNGYKYLKTDESTGIITLSKNALPAGSSSVKIELNNFFGVDDLPSQYPEYQFKLALASGIEKSATVDAAWSVSGTTATYKTGGTNATFKVADDGMSISYLTASSQPKAVATIKGLKKGTKASSIFVNDNVITLTKDMLGTTNVTLAVTEDSLSAWKLAVPTDGTVVEPTLSKESYWKVADVKDKKTKEVVSTTATFVTPKVDKSGAGYTVSDDGKTITYAANNSGGKNTLQLKGLAPELEATAADDVTASTAGTLQGVTYDTKAATVTIYSEAMVEDTPVQIAGTVTAGTNFAFGVDSDSNVASGTIQNTTKTAVVLTGNTGDDSLVGGAGADTIYGGTGVDVLNGNAGNDVLYSGGDSSDAEGSAKTLIGGAGNDTLIGQNTEAVAIDEATERATVILDAGAGNDYVVAGEGGGSLSGGAGNDTMFGGAGADTLDGGAGNDKLYSGAGNATTLIGGAGNDTLIGQNTALVDTEGETLEGGSFDAYSDYSSIVLDGGAGNDVMYSGTGGGSLNGGAGNDKLYGSDGNDALLGDVGNDTLQGGAGSDYMDGGAGNDKMYAGTGSAEMSGGAGNDTLYAESANATLDGGAGVDHLYGGTGKVQMTGGDGNDTFYFSTEYSSDNVITDYTNGKSGKTTVKDTIKLTDYSAKSVTATTDGESVFLDVGGKTLTVNINSEIATSSIYIVGVNAKNKADNVTINIAGLGEAENSGLFAEDNFVTADSLSQIVETASVGEFELNTDPSKLQAENLITYSDK